jgi:hypothetical protein
VTDADKEEGGFRGSLRADLRRCRSAHLHLLAPGVISATLALAAIAFVVVSGAVGTPVDFVSFVGIVTTNSAWLFGSVFALVGLFVAYPARGSGEDRRGSSVVGTLVLRWLLVVIGVVIGSVAVFAVGVTAFDSFGIVSFIAFALLTMVTVCAYVSIGVTLAALTHTEERLVLSLLSVYVFFVHLWDTALLPTLVAMAVVGDAAGVVGSPPPFYDALLALSPYGAYAALSNAVVGDTGGGVSMVAAFAFFLWLFVPPLLAVLLTD